MGTSGMVEAYLKRFPLAVMYVSRAGLELFATEQARRQCEAWNGGLPRSDDAGRSARLPQAVEQMALDARRSIKSMLGKRPAKSGWVIRHPRYQGSYVHLEECPPSADNPVAGYWVSFVEQEPPAEADAAGDTPELLQRLTPRERNVARLTAQGMSNSEIAVAIGRSIRTVEFQLGAIYRKLGVRSRTQLVLALAATPKLQLSA